MSDIVERLGVAWEKQPGAAMTKINRILIERKDAIAEITRLRQLLSEAEKREREAREKLQAMHRRAQESERIEQMVIETMSRYDRYLTVGCRSHRILFKIVLRDLLRSAEKIRSRRALQSEER